MLTTVENPFLNFLTSDRKMPNVLRAKCIVVGDSCVGKTSVVQAFVNESRNFQRNYNMTCGIDICTKKVSVPDTDDIVQLYTYDCAGKELYFDFITQMWDNPSAICIVFDIANENSFKNCSHWLESVRKSSSHLTVPGVLVGNKTDLIKRRLISKEAAAEFAKQNNLVYFECSAMEGEGIEEPFFYLVNEWHKLYLEKTEMLKTVS